MMHCLEPIFKPNAATCGASLSLSRGMRNQFSATSLLWCHSSLFLPLACSATGASVILE